MRRRTSSGLEYDDDIDGRGGRRASLSASYSTGTHHLFAASRCSCPCSAASNRTSASLPHAAIEIELPEIPGVGGTVDEEMYGEGAQLVCT